LRANDDTMLEPGMTFHFMPGLWMDDWGIETTETILINEKGGPTLFTNLPRELTVKP
ncbi:MAG: ectoine hydrolase DoeA, partial [Proteobacteria bacterium]|nr:ectoine hydrolase DoeA [Pseudomonadota bacterium]